MRQERVEVDEHQWAPLLLAQAVDERVVRDAVDPRREFLRRVEALEVLVAAHEHFLHDVLDVLRARKEFPTVAQELLFVALDQDAKALTIAFLHQARGIFVSHVSIVCFHPGIVHRKALFSFICQAPEGSGACAAAIHTPERPKSTSVRAVLPFAEYFSHHSKYIQEEKARANASLRSCY